MNLEQAIARLDEIQAEAQAVIDAGRERYTIVRARPYRGMSNKVKMLDGDRKRGIKPVWGRLYNAAHAQTVASVLAADVVRWCTETRPILVKDLES
jgi:hypothetical protein